MVTTVPPICIENPRRIGWTVDSLQAALNAGVLDDKLRYEIVLGELFQKVGQNWPHRFAVDALVQAFASLDRSQFLVSAQMPLAIGADRPEPDLQIVSGSLRSRKTMPAAADALLVVEVSDTTSRFDRDVKGPAYAAAGIPVFWIVDLNQTRIEILTRPEGGQYSEIGFFGPGDILPPPFFEAPSILAASLFQLEPDVD